MPRRALMPCRKPGCRTLVEQSGYCEPHRLEWQRQGAKSREQDPHYHSAAWKRLRAIVLRSAPLCAHCIYSGRITPATQVDHVIPRAAGGDDSLDNLQALCARCHSRKTASFDGGFGRPAPAPAPGGEGGGGSISGP